MRRRDLFAVAAGVATLAESQSMPVTPRKGRIKQAAFVQNFGSEMPFEEMCSHAAQLGMKGFDAAQTENWPTLRKYGLVPTLAYPHVTIPPYVDGIARSEHHDDMERRAHAEIDLCAARGCPTIPLATGQRRGTSYEEGADNCVAFLNRIKAHAEDKGVNLCPENMNKYDRPDQFCDHLAWGFDVCKRANSPRVKLLLDIYHAQIMDGDICRQISDNIQWIGHFHVAGVPGRHEPDDGQELNYRFIARTIADLGFSGYVAHEWTPSAGRDPIQTLARAIEILDA
jgi:hydroxypyruvate isomerase